jgi:hypothetical protein
VGKTLDSGLVLQVVCEELGVEESEMHRQRKGSVVRPIAARMLCTYAGLTQREVASELKLATGAAVSMQLRRLREMLETDEKIARKVRRIQKQLTAELAS